MQTNQKPFSLLWIVVTILSPLCYFIELPPLPQTDHIQSPLTLNSPVSDLRIEAQVIDNNDFSIRGVGVVSD
jgi:hypothetical protein